MSFPFVRRAAFILIKGNRLLVIEVESGISETDLGDLKCNLAWAAIDEVRIVRSIPVDARHNAKVNYPKLMAELQKK